MTLFKGAKPRSAGVVIPSIDLKVSPGQLAALPNAPVGPVDRESKVSSWLMYLNDSISDCTFAGAGHTEAQLTAFSGKVPGGAMFSDSVIETGYSAVSGYNPVTGANDNGCELYQVANYMMSTGLTDTSGKLHKWAGYADVSNYTDLAYLKQLLACFGTLYCGVSVGDADETAFSDGQPWTLPSTGRNVGPDGIDHCVVMSYSAYGDAGIGDDQTFITWGAEQRANQNWVLTNLGEVLVPISQDWLEANGDSPLGQSMTELITELKALPESKNPSDV